MKNLKEFDVLILCFVSTVLMMDVVYRAIAKLRGDKMNSVQITLILFELFIVAFTIVSVYVMRIL